MRGRQWLESFIIALDETEDVLDSSTDESWTRSIGIVMDKIGENLHCGVSRKRVEIQNQESEEYLNIDFMFFDKRDYDSDRSVLPRTVVEHENSFDKNKIEYCLWKILCVRSPIKVLICYQRNAADV
jgi:hypothetical protein